jgi:hypothetical protein
MIDDTLPLALIRRIGDQSERAVRKITFDP